MIKAAEYVTRDGRMVEVTDPEKHGMSVFTVVGRFDGYFNGKWYPICHWTAEGRYRMDGNEHPLDLHHKRADGEPAPILLQRAAIARGKSEWYAGESPARAHPLGVGGLRHILPSELTSNCWDTHPRGWKCSEWGNATGTVD